MIDLRFQLLRPDFSLDVALALPAKGVTALFGPSGSGKTTLLRCLAGLERVRCGRLVFQGQIWQDETHWRPTHQRPLAYVFQEASLFPHLSVLGNLEFGRRRASTAGRVALDQAIELLGIGQLLDRRPDGLSGGERQRVSMARALAVGPEVLLMDEPLAALDYARKQEILPYLERLRDELAIPMIYVSHAPDEIARLADYLVALDAGRVVSHGPLLDTLSRIDLPIALGEDMGVVLDAAIADIDPNWHLARVDFKGGSVWCRDRGLPVGKRVRVRVLARDVSLALERSTQSSIQNIHPATVESIAPDGHPSQVLVRLKLGDSPLVARITARAAEQLGIRPGLPVFAQIKSVALMA